MTGEAAVGLQERLHPTTILKELGNVAWAILIVLVGFDVPVGPVEVPSLDIVLAVVLFGYAVLRYYFTSYTVSEATLELRRGVLVKTTQTMPRDRIQAVDVNTPLIGRFLGISTVEVSAADTAVIKLEYVSDRQAERLRSLLQRSAQPIDDGAREDVPIVELNTPTIGDILLYSLTATGTIVGLSTLVLANILALVAGIWWANVGTFLPAVLAMGWVFSNIVGLRSWIEDGRLRLRSGVLARAESNSPLERIQTIQVHRPVARRLLGFETLTAASGELAVDVSSMAPVAPLVAIGEWRRLASLILGRSPLAEADLRRSSPLTVRRALVRGVGASLLVALLTTVPLVFGLVDVAVNLAVTGLILVTGVVVSARYARRRYRILGWHRNAEDLLVRRGAWAESLALVPIHKIQDVTLTETFFQRRLGLASVEVDTAGVVSRSIVAVDLERGEALDLALDLSRTAAAVALPDGV